MCSRRRPPWYSLTTHLVHPIPSPPTCFLTPTHLAHLDIARDSNPSVKMKLSSLSVLALLPVLNALKFPHITPQAALSAADNFLHPGSSHDTAATTLGYANDITLSSVPGDEHVVLTSVHHPVCASSLCSTFPTCRSILGLRHASRADNQNHRVRIKSTDGWCDPSVRSYSGYLDVGDGRDLFFYFFESRSNPKEDPVLMWINGKSCVLASSLRLTF